MPPLRADAERNQRRVLEAAIGVLQASPEAGMREIADASGIGRSTLYRHFPTRASLEAALYERVIEQAHERIQARVAEVRAGAAGEPALRALVGDLVGLGQEAMFLYTAAPARRKGDADAAAEETMTAFVGLLQADGTLRADVPAAWPGTVLEGLLSAALVQAERGVLPAAGLAALIADALLRAVGG